MARTEETGRVRPEDDDAVPARRGAGRGTLTLFLVLVLVVYAAVLVISRTPGGRSLAADRLGDVFGFPVEIGAMHLTPSLVLELRQVRGRAVAAREGDPRPLVLDIERMRLRLDLLLNVRRIDVEKGGVTLVPQADGTWYPPAFMPWVRWLEQVSGLGMGMDPAAPLAAEDQPLLRRLTTRLESLPDPQALRREIRVRGLAVKWADAMGGELASVSRAEVDLTPVELPRRRLLHVRLAADAVRRHDGQGIERLAVERMISADDEWTLAEAYGDGARPFPASPIERERLRLAVAVPAGPAVAPAPPVPPPAPDPETVIPILPPEVSPPPGE